MKTLSTKAQEIRASWENEVEFKELVKDSRNLEILNALAETLAQ